ncbi:MAG: flagellar hook capping FlgD N-terminal domain-containing protein [Pseudomonadota bacterium]
MTDLNTINELFPPPSETNTRGANSVEDLGSEAFLELMVAQLENQDPSKPLDNTEFVAQLAQFGTVSGVQELNESFASLGATLTASQSWQAASLVGREVVGESNVAQLEAIEDGDGEFSLTATVDFQGNPSGGTLFIQDLSGRLIHSEALPAGQSGEFQIQWDGRDSNGELVPEGSYRVSAEGQINGQNTAIPVYAHLQVSSVAVDSSTGAVTLNLSDGTSLPIEQVKQFL